MTMAAARAGNRAGTSLSFSQRPWSLLFRCTWPKETFPKSSEISQPLYTDGRRRCRTYVQVYLEELTSYQGKAGHSVLDTAQQTQGHQCWGETNGVSNSLLVLGANTTSHAQQLFFQKSPGLQVDSGQLLDPSSECSVLSSNVTEDVISLMSSACHCYKWRGRLTAPVDVTFMHPGILLSMIRDMERGDVG